MPAITLPIDGQEPYGAVLRQAINDINDAVDDINDAWMTYTPTLTNFSFPLLSAKYKQIGKTVLFKIRATYRLGSSITGNPTFTLPVAAASASSVFGSAFFSDVTATGFGGTLVQDSTTVVSTRALNTASTYGTFASLSSTIPFTWATNDYIDIGGIYEAA